MRRVKHLMAVAILMFFKVSLVLAQDQIQDSKNFLEKFLEKKQGQINQQVKRMEREVLEECYSNLCKIYEEIESWKFEVFLKDRGIELLPPIYFKIGGNDLRISYRQAKMLGFSKESVIFGVSWSSNEAKNKKQGFNFNIGIEAGAGKNNFEILGGIKWKF